jgi:hypothetical protein
MRRGKGGDKMESYGGEGGACVEWTEVEKGRF